MMHALNNALGYSFATVQDMADACGVLLREHLHEGILEVRAEHERAGGWYSSECLAKALHTTSLRRYERAQYVWQLEPLRVHPHALEHAVGAVVNIDNRHWVALRLVDKQVWLLDSQNPAPAPIAWTEYLSFIREHVGAFRIEES